MVLVFLKIGERDFEYPALQRIVRVLKTGGAVDESLADAAEEIMLSIQSIEDGRITRPSWARGLTLGSGMFLAP